MEAKERKLTVANYSPLHPISAVIVCPIGPEAVLGTCLPPKISLFEPKPGANVLLARGDHNLMVASYRERGINVINMREILGNELAVNQNHNRFSTKETLLAEIVSRGEKLINRYHRGKVEDVAYKAEFLLNMDMRAMDKEAALAVNAVLTGCVDYKTGKEKPFSFRESPIANILYTRDTMHITGNEIAVNRMRFPIRRPEVDLARIVLNALGIEFRQISDYREHPLRKFYLEGGDYLPMEFDGSRYAMIGQGERTSKEGVESWFRLHEKQFSATGEGLIPVVVVGPSRKQQDQMHLDTHTQQVAKDAAIHCGEITSNRTAFTLVRRGDRIARIDEVRFDKWLQRRVANLFDMSRDDQKKYAPNVLTDPARGEVHISRNDAPDVINFFRSIGLNPVWAGMKEFTKFFGGKHCGGHEFREPTN